MPKVKVLADFTPPETVEEGDMVADAFFFNPVPLARSRFTPAPNLNVTVPVRFVLRPDVATHSLDSEAGMGRLPSNRKIRTQIEHKDAVIVDPEDHDKVMEELRRRDEL